MYLCVLSPHLVLLFSLGDQSASEQRRRGLDLCIQRRRRAAVFGYVTCWPTSASSLKGQLEEFLPVCDWCIWLKTLRPLFHGQNPLKFVRNFQGGISLKYDLAHLECELQNYDVRKLWKWRTVQLWKGAQKIVCWNGTSIQIVAQLRMMRIMMEVKAITPLCHSAVVTKSQNLQGPLCALVSLTSARRKVVFFLIKVGGSNDCHR